jgi:long-chain acyl-CoA synthetase
MLVHHLLAETAQRFPSKRSLITTSGEAFTFAELGAWSDKVACALQDLGIRRGDRVAIMMENSPQLVASLFGVSKAGGVFVVVNPLAKSTKLAYILNDCGVRCLIADSRLAHVVSSALGAAPAVEKTIWSEDVPPTIKGGLSFREIGSGAPREPADPGLIDSDLAAIIYTSGTTGEPKGVMLTHRNIHHNAWSISNYLGNTPDDVVVCLLPLSFTYGLFQAIVGAGAGYAALLERSFAYPYEVMQRIAAYRVTGLPGVPTMFATILQMAPFEALDLSSVRYVTNAAAPLPPTHVAGLLELFPHARIYSMYGLTECTRASYLDPDRIKDKVGSVGNAIPNTEVYVVDDHGHRVPPGVVGELVVRGANVMRGYWGKSEETAKRLRDGEILGEKVLYTGDQFWMDEEGFLFFVGREDDIFKCKGEKISPKEIEDVLYELDEVAEAAVVGMPDPIDGMAIKAVVVARDGRLLTEQLVRLHCRKRLESYKLPKVVEIRESLPKTESGKIKKTALV